MVGMLQILTYLLAFYLVVKGFQILVTAYASPREDKSGLIALAWLVFVACVLAAIMFSVMQDNMAQSISGNLTGLH